MYYSLSLFRPFHQLNLVSTHSPIAYEPHWSCSAWVDAGLAGHWSYIHTIRKPRIHGQVVEVKTQLTHRDYINMLAQRDDSHFTIFKRRRCFLDNNQYFQLDIYKEPCHPRSVYLLIGVQDGGEWVLFKGNVIYFIQFLYLLHQLNY